MDSPSEEKHSRFGVASFVTSLTVGLLILVVFVVAGILHNRHAPEPYPGQTLVGLIMIGLVFADLAAAGLGIAALCDKGRKKVFGILGLSFSVLTLLATCGLIAVGLRATGRL